MSETLQTLHVKRLGASNILNLPQKAVFNFPANSVEYHLDCNLALHFQKLVPYDVLLH